jgi:hypothetical protein
MAHHELFALNSDPHHGDLRAAVAIERGQMSERSFFAHLAHRLRNLHMRLSLQCVRVKPYRSCDAKHDQRNNLRDDERGLRLSRSHGFQG